MSVLQQHKGVVPSGVIVKITSAPEGETELTVGSLVWVAGVDDSGRVNVILYEGHGAWRSFNPEEFEWREVPTLDLTPAGIEAASS